MNPWFVRLLGRPEAEREGGRAHLRSRPTWGLLASLLMEERDGWLSREALVDRFWSDCDSSASSMRNSLTSIRRAFGDDCLESDGRLIRLKKSLFRTDLQQIDAIESASAEASGRRRLAHLTALDALLRGDFLQGCDDPLDSSVRWIGTQRAHWSVRSAHLLRLSAEALEEAENAYAAFEAASRAVRFDPVHEEGWSLVWRLGTRVGKVSDAQALHDTFTFDQAIPRVADREQCQKPLTVREQKAFRDLLDHRVSALPPRLQKALHRLSVFDSPFRAEVALAICGTGAEVLQRLAKVHLLQRAAGLPDGVYGMLQAIREFSWACVPTSLRRRLARRHVAYCLGWVEAVNGGREARYLREDEVAKHMGQAVRQQMDSGDERGTLQLLNNLFMLGMLTYQTGMPFLSRIAAEEEHPLRDRLLALTVAANLSAAEGNFNVAAEMADSGLSLCNDQVTLRTRTELHRLKARACHHLEQAEQALAHTRTAQELSRLDSEPLLVMDALRFEGEILRSTGKVDEASVVLEEALAICRVQQARPTELSETLFQCAVAERRSGRTEEARARIDEALEIRMDLQADHGAADCLREVAALERERGDLTLVRARLEHALILYERCGGKGGRAATLGELGDLYRMMGRVSDARRSYEEALRFWEEAGHDGWSDHLRSRLDSTSAE